MCHDYEHIGNRRTAGQRLHETGQHLVAGLPYIAALFAMDCGLWWLALANI